MMVRPTSRYKCRGFELLALGRAVNALKQGNTKFRKHENADFSREFFARLSAFRV
jgi:hypothetical protein